MLIVLLCVALVWCTIQADRPLVCDTGRPQGIMLIILFIMLFQISQKIGSLCSLLFFYALHCYDYSIIFVTIQHCNIIS